MKNYLFLKRIILAILLLAVTLWAEKPIIEESRGVYWTIPERTLPLPHCASKEFVRNLKSVPPPDIDTRRSFEPPKSKDEWLDIIAYSKARGAKGVYRFASDHNVTISTDKVGDITVYTLMPKGFKKESKKHLFIYLHGGGYIFGGGLSGLSEAILIAQRVQIPVLSIDYRMPPSHPYPADINDVVRVYKTIIQSHLPDKVAMGGSSSGGGLTMAVVQKLKSLNLPLPAALYLGTPWADLSKSGDSLYINEGIDRKLGTYDGFLASAAKLYAGRHGLKEAGLSPVYGDVSGFPPTMLVSGTRDLFLSMAVRVHRKLKKEGVVADLNIYEGLSHVEYFVFPDTPESLEVYGDLKSFLKKHLRKF